MEELFSFQDKVLDDHELIKKELEQLQKLVDNFENRFELTTIKPIPVKLIQGLMEIRDVLKNHTVYQIKETANCPFDFNFYLQTLASAINYLYKYNKSLERLSSDFET